MAIDLDALLTALERDPAARARIRQAVLSRDLLELPARVEDRIAHVDERFAQVEGQIGRLATRMEQLAGYVGDLRGTVYQRGAVRPRMVAGAVGAPVAQVHLAPPDDLAARLEAATTAGILTEQEADAIEVANGVFVWHRGNGAGPVYCVVEASITPGSTDVERAATRTASLAKTGVETRAIVLSDGVPPPDLAAIMQARGVAWRRVQSPQGPSSL